MLSWGIKPYETERNDDKCKKQDHHELVLGVEIPFEVSQLPFDGDLFVYTVINLAFEGFEFIVKVNVLYSLLDIMYCLQ